MRSIVSWLPTARIHARSFISCLQIRLGHDLDRAAPLPAKFFIRVAERPKSLSVVHFFASSAMSWPSKEGGDSNGGGERFVSAQAVHHRNGSQTVVTKQITTPIAAAGSQEVILGTVTETRPYANNQVVEGAAPPSVLPITSDNAIVYFWLGCMTVTSLVAYYGSANLFLANLLLFGPVFTTVLRRLQEPQQQLQGR